MHWIYLLIAGIFEISWAIGLKFSHGFTQIIPSIITVICMILSFYFLAIALKIYRWVQLTQFGQELEPLEQLF